MKIKWHTDNPPPIEREYLVTSTRGSLFIASWTCGMFTDDWYWVSDNMFLRVAAWAPLPEPYKENME